MVTDPSSKGLATLKDTLNLAMDNIRNSVHDLYDESIDLGEQIQKLTESFTFCRATLNLHMETVPEPRVKYAILAIIKEALSNVVKHSSASRVDISLVEHPGFYQLIVSDNGSTVTYNPDDGIGLKNIAHRIEALKGYFLIRTNKGFELFITIPKEQTL
jgi:signal transduction histidine kinase